MKFHGIKPCSSKGLPLLSSNPKETETLPSLQSAHPLSEQPAA